MDRKIQPQNQDLGVKTGSKIWLPIAISILALAISFFSLYFSQLRSAIIKIVAGEHVSIMLFEEGNYSFSVSVAFSNHGAKPATATRVALIIESPNGKRHLLEPRVYLKPPFEPVRGDFPIESKAVPIVLDHREIVVKEIIFRSSLASTDEFKITKGEYKFRLLGWIDDSEIPKEFKPIITIKVSQDHADTLKEPLKFLKIRRSEWEKWAAHSLTEGEAKALGLSGR